MRSNSIFIVLAAILVSHSSFAEEQYGNLLGCPVTDISTGEYEGQSFLNLIKEVIKPELDGVATDGYMISDGDRLVDVLEMVDTKVYRQVLDSVNGESKTDKIESLRGIGDALNGQVATLYTSPDMIAGTGLARDRYTLSTYIGLANCGGSHLKLADDNYAYNIHYGTGDEDKDQQTGRSFGASRIYHATDSSYTHYLNTLQSYISKNPDNVREFMLTAMQTLTNTDPRNYSEVTDDGDAVLTDFFAIWSAEQTRNLMDGRVDLHWDAALLQVTLLSAFHAGQDKIKLFYRDPMNDKTVYFTDSTYDLAWPKKNKAKELCVVDFEKRKNKAASLKDYIGIHYATYKHCGRSGINMSRNEWKLLSREITSYMLADEEGAQLIENVRRYLRPFVDTSENEYGKSYEEGEEDILREIARFLINGRAPAKINNWEKLSKSTVALLEYMRENANDITKVISKKHRKKMK